MISNQRFPYSQIHLVSHGCGKPELGLCSSDALTGSIVGVRLPSGVGWALGTDPGPWPSHRFSAQDQLKAWRPRSLVGQNAAVTVHIKKKKKGWILIAVHHVLV